MKQLIHLVNISRRPEYRASARIMTEIFTVSRLKYKPDLLPLKSVCPLPEWKQNFSLSFEDVALERAADLWKNKSDHVQLLWSGGIDSTTALVALIITRPAAGKITVLCNLNSIMENREFYQKLLELSFIDLKNSSSISPEYTKELITGELGDQIFGSDLLLAISNSFGFQAIHEPFEKIIPAFFIKRCGEEFGRPLFERYSPITHEAPFKIKSAYDFVWWWNFTQKWQCIKFHQKSLIDERVEAVHFFEDERFEQWSAHNHALKITDNLNSYKMPAKKFIFSFDRNTAYLENKKKYASPLGNTRHFYALYDDGSRIKNFDECYNLIERLASDEK